jgi:thiol:disulfide interchange protein
MELLSILGAAFVGGIILNVMPCVLPVLTMKVFHIVEHSEQTPAEVRRHGVAYALGILLTFAVFAAIVVALKMAGELVQWGMQFQNPAFVAGLTTVMVAFGLNALGVFELSVGINSSGGDSSLRSSFVNGVVATVLATPCSAPFIVSAATYALAAGTPGWQTLAVFEAIGLGLALPFLAISFVPRLRGRLVGPASLAGPAQHGLRPGHLRDATRPGVGICAGRRRPAWHDRRAEDGAVRPGRGQQLRPVHR